MSRGKRLGTGAGERPNVHVLWVGEAHFQEALDRLFSHEDDRWSLTDCTSFVLMKGMEIGAAFSFDSDFSQAGFALLPLARRRSAG